MYLEKMMQVHELHHKKIVCDLEKSGYLLHLIFFFDLKSFQVDTYSHVERCSTDPKINGSFVLQDLENLKR